MDQQLSDEVRYLTTKLGDIVREQAGVEVFAHVERIRQLSKTIRAQSQIADIHRKRRMIGRLAVDQAYQVAHAFSLFFQLVNLCEERARIRKLTENPEPAQSLRRLFRELREAGVSETELQACLDNLDIEPVLTAHPTEAKRRSVIYQLWRVRRHIDRPDEVLETLWQTEEIHERKLQPLDEVDNNLAFFDRTIFDAVAAFYQTFDRELKARYPTLERRTPFLTFGSWVGGDRDGNPHVTPAISRETLERHRRCVLAFYQSQCELLIDELSHSRHSRSGRPAPSGPGEVFRAQIAATAGKLAQPDFQAERFIADLRRVQQALVDQNAWRTASGRIDRLITQASVFGFHLAGLDFREDAAKLRDSPEEILTQLRTLREIQQGHGPEAAHRFVLSMTHSADDVLELLKLARRAKLQHLDLVPLFETIDDLHACADVMRELYSDPAYRAHLGSRGDVQGVMLGYSDSNKDGGYLAANWFLHRAQSQLAEAAEDFSVKLRLFHGKGGSVDRGGGHSHRSLRAQPFAAHGGRLRITEQGEVISLKYSTPEIAQRNLEQLTSAVIAAVCLPPPDETHRTQLPGWYEAMEQLARDSLHFYQDLVYGTADFQAYFWQATPIDVIEQLRLGSRPSRRKKHRDLRSLRAIPWTFAWTQSRHLISAWYGIGHALETFMQMQVQGRDTLREMYVQWPFFATLIDNAQQSLAKADMYIAAQYATLATPVRIRERIFGRIREEYERSVAMVLDVCEADELLADDPVLKESIRLRNPYVDPLNYLQIHSLPQWRKASGAQPGGDLQRLLALSVAGIAFGMKSTG